MLTFLPRLPTTETRKFDLSTLIGKSRLFTQTNQSLTAKTYTGQDCCSVSVHFCGYADIRTGYCRWTMRLYVFYPTYFFKFGSSIFDFDSLVEAATTQIVIPMIYDCLGPLFSKGGCRYLTCATISMRAVHTKTGFVKASNEFSEFWLGRTVTKYLHPVLTWSATSCSHFHRTANTPLVEFVFVFCFGTSVFAPISITYDPNRPQLVQCEAVTLRSAALPYVNIPLKYYIIPSFLPECSRSYLVKLNC